MPENPKDNKENEELEEMKIYYERPLNLLIDTVSHSSLLDSASDINQLNIIIDYIDTFYVACSTPSSQAVLNNYLEMTIDEHKEKGFIYTHEHYVAQSNFFVKTLKSMFRKGFFLRFIEQKYNYSAKPGFGNEEILPEKLEKEIFKGVNYYSKNPDHFKHKDFLLKSIKEGYAENCIGNIKITILNFSRSEYFEIEPVKENVLNNELNTLKTNICDFFLVGYCYRAVEQSDLSKLTPLFFHELGALPS